jgi:thiamine-phosphate pyrophosphorylase
MTWKFPQLYPILDSKRIPLINRAEYLNRLGQSLADAGVTLLEYRNKPGSDSDVLADAVLLRASMPGSGIKLILDDRVQLVEQAGFDGTHVDAGDLSPDEARRILGKRSIVGTFGGTEALVPGAIQLPVDYLSIGPVYPTTTKQTSKTPIGPEGIRRLRAEAGSARVLVAVGGITFETAPLVLAAGATTVGVAAGIFQVSDPAAEFRRWMKALA